MGALVMMRGIKNVRDDEVTDETRIGLGYKR